MEAKVCSIKTAFFGTMRLAVRTVCCQVEYLADGTSSERKKLKQEYVNDKDGIQREGMKCQMPGPVSASAKIMKRAIMQLVCQSFASLPLPLTSIIHLVELNFRNYSCMNRNSTKKTIRIGVSFQA